MEEPAARVPCSSVTWLCLHPCISISAHYSEKQKTRAYGWEPLKTESSMCFVCVFCLRLVLLMWLGHLNEK